MECQLMELRRKLCLVAMVSFCLSLFVSIGKNTEAYEASKHRGVRFEKISISESLKRAKKENKLVLLDFYAPI